MKRSEIPVFETKDANEQFEGLAIVIRRGQRSVDMNEPSFGVRTELLTLMVWTRRERL